jgi:hypothetical protein
LEIVNSISRPDRIFETSGSQPALILCDDFNYYVCKYNRQPGGKAVKLFHEFLAGTFAKLWNLAVPDFCFVNVNPTHIEEYGILQPAFFKALCFGSKYNSGYSEIDEFYADMPTSDKRKFELKYEFLKIGLFDIWLANEDRNFNNYNLLIDVQNKNRFIPIDHDAIFNTGNLHRGLELLSDNETLINTDLTRRLFTATELRSKDFFEKTKNDYYLCVAECKKNSSTILQDIPDEWRINSAEYLNLLNIHLFSKDWTNKCFNYFQELINLQF